MTLRNYARIVGGDGPPLVGLVSDLWQALPTGVQFDVVIFNVPFIAFPLSSDPAIVRSRCLGAALADRLLDELSSRMIMAPDGVRLTDTLERRANAGYRGSGTPSWL